MLHRRLDPGQHRGHGLLGQPLDGRRVPVPGRVAGERGEVRIPRRVHLLVGVHQRDRRELVEDDEHDRGPRAHVLLGDVRRLDEHELRGVRVEQEERQEHERNGREHRQERADRCDALVEQGAEDADAAAATTSAPSPESADRFASAWSTITPTKPATKSRWSDLAGPPVHEPHEKLDREQRCGRHDDEEEREEHDLRARGAANREELGVPAEDVEERLGDRERREHGKPRAVDQGYAKEARLRFSLGQGAACVVPPPEFSERTTSKRSFRQRSNQSAPVIGMVVRPLAGEQAAGHRVFRRHELDHDRPRRRAQPVEELRDRDVPRDRHVVDQREAERQVGLAALGQRPPLGAPPPQSGRRVDDVQRQRQDLFLLLLAQRAVEPVDDERRPRPSRRRSPRVSAAIREWTPSLQPMSQTRLGPSLFDRLAHEPGLPLGVLVRSTSCRAGSPTTSTAPAPSSGARSGARGPSRWRRSARA